MVELPIIFKCNNNCISCISNNAFFSHSTPPIANIKESISSINSMDYFCATGGEPTLRQDLLEILKYARKRHPQMHILLLSNGRMFFYEDYAKKLSSLKLTNFRVAVALYSHTAEIHDYITQAEGSFKQTVQGIKNLLKHNLEVELRILVNKLNYKELGKISSFIVKNFDGLGRVVFINMKYTGNAYKNKDKIFVKISKAVPFAENAVDTLQKNKIKVLLFHFPLCIIDKKYWDIAEGITKNPEELTFVEQCNSCSLKKKCPRIWKTYIPVAGSNEFNAIRADKYV